MPVKRFYLVVEKLFSKIASRNGLHAESKVSVGQKIMPLTARAVRKFRNNNLEIKK